MMKKKKHIEKRAVPHRPPIVKLSVKNRPKVLSGGPLIGPALK